MSDPQPTEAQEQANAAYVWRKKVQGDFIDAMRQVNITLDDAEWWFNRFTRAYAARSRPTLQRKRSGLARPPPKRKNVAPWRTKLPMGRGYRKSGGFGGRTGRGQRSH